MREQLIQYVDLLFAGNSDAEEVKQEILQNTLDRYDDLISQGKNPEAAYRLAISGIGDLDEIWSTSGTQADSIVHSDKPVTYNDSTLRRIMRAVAIGLYIISPIPLFILSEMQMEVIGLCGTIAIVAIATVILLLFRKTSENTAASKANYEETTPNGKLKKSIDKLIGALGLGIYFIISFASGAWYITWLVFPIMAAVKGLVQACIDLRECE